MISPEKWVGIVSEGFMKACWAAVLKGPGGEHC